MIKQQSQMFPVKIQSSFDAIHCDLRTILGAVPQQGLGSMVMCILAV